MVNSRRKYSVESILASLTLGLRRIFEIDKAKIAAARTNQALAEVAQIRTIYVASICGSNNEVESNRNTRSFGNDGLVTLWLKIYYCMYGK